MVKTTTQHLFFSDLISSLHNLVISDVNVRLDQPEQIRKKLLMKRTWIGQEQPSKAGQLLRDPQSGHSDFELIFLFMMMMYLLFNVLYK